MSDKLPTIKEIARKLNVSVSTVSRALSDHPRIGLRTKLRVKELAEQLGYEPNQTAILFKQRKTYTIGVVLPYIREEFFSQAISGIESTAIHHDYTILFGQSYDDPQKEKAVVEAMKKHRVDGLLISLSKETNSYEHLEGLERYNIPVVYFDRVPNLDNVNKVYCDMRKGTIKLVNWLFDQGKKRIAFINGPEKLMATKERLQGYIDAQAGRRKKIDMRLVEQTDLQKESTYEAMQKLLNLKNPPDAVISFNDYVHMDAVKYAEMNGIKVNDEIVFVSYANLPITSYTAYPPQASLEQYPYLQGVNAIEILIEIMDNNSGDEITERKYVSQEIQADLIDYTK